MRTHPSHRLDPTAVAWGAACVVVAMVLVVIGSSGFTWFDAALVGYLFGTLFAIFGTVYRYVVWLRRPPTAKLNQRGWTLLREPGRRGRNLLELPRLVFDKLIVQSFIYRRSRARWAAHQLIFWGCVLAALVTFPLVFGWLHFESASAANPRVYRVYLADIGLPGVFDSRGVVGWFIIHALDVSAVLVLGGVFIFLARRLRDPGALAVERSADFLPLAGLFAVSVTGLMLTFSNLWLEGRFYTFLTTIHALTVILGLMYIPFGKLFHIFQRPGNLGVAYYKQAARTGPQATCRRCGAQWLSQMQVDDLKEILPQLGFDYTTSDGDSYQDYCPACRRRLVTLAQSGRVGGFG